MRTKNERFWASVSLRLRSKISVISSACSFSSNSEAKSVMISQAVSELIKKIQFDYSPSSFRHIGVGEIRAVPISSSLAFCATAQNRMIYFSLTDAGTMCNFPEALMLLSNFSFNLSDPIKRKQTKPNWQNKISILWMRNVWLWPMGERWRKDDLHRNIPSLHCKSRNVYLSERDLQTVWPSECDAECSFAIRKSHNFAKQT